MKGKVLAQLTCFNVCAYDTGRVTEESYVANAAGKLGVCVCVIVREGGRQSERERAESLKRERGR